MLGRVKVTHDGFKHGSNIGDTFKRRVLGQLAMLTLTKLFQYTVEIKIYSFGGKYLGQIRHRFLRLQDGVRDDLHYWDGAFNNSCQELAGSVVLLKFFDVNSPCMMNSGSAVQKAAHGKNKTLTDTKGTT